MPCRFHMEPAEKDGSTQVCLDQCPTLLHIAKVELLASLHEIMPRYASSEPVVQVLAVLEENTEHCLALTLNVNSWKLVVSAQKDAGRMRSSKCKVWNQS